MNRALSLATSQPWLMQSEALQTLIAIAAREGDVEALQTREGRPLDNAHRVEMRDGIAVIPVVGPIFRYANLFTQISGATSTQMLARDIQTALDNRYVRGIVLDINSPGGEATGINELSKLICAGRAIKPIKAYAGGSMASGAYWLGSAADEIIIDDTAALGSIGVVMTLSDTRKRDAENGVRQIEIVSSQSPDKRIDPASDEGRAKVQAMVDALAEVFVAAVARHRGVSEAHVLAEFGQGGVLIGAAAVKARMADRIGSLESVIAALAGSASTSHRNLTMSTVVTELNARIPASDSVMAQARIPPAPNTIAVTTTADLHAALSAGHSPEQIAIDTGAVIAAARAEGEAAGRKAATEIAVQAERARIAELQSLARPGFEAELTAAINAGDSAANFALTLMKAAQARGITLDAMRADAPPAAPHARPADSTPPRPTLSAAGIFATRRKAASAHLN